MDEYDNYVNYIDGLRRHQISSVEPLWEISEQYENIYKTYITRSIGAVLEARGLLRHFIGISTLSQCGKIIFKHHNKFLTFVKQKKSLTFYQFLITICMELFIWTTTLQLAVFTES